MADAADGADGTFESRANAYHPAAFAALTAERDVDAQRPQERLRPAQSAGERARAFGPAVPGNAVTAATGARTQEIGGATCPRAALGHDLPHAGGDRVGIDGIVDSCPAVAGVGPREGAPWPSRGLAGGGPEGEVGHARQPPEPHQRQHAQAMAHRIQQRAKKAGTGELERAPKLLLRSPPPLREVWQCQE